MRCPVACAAVVLVVLTVSACETPDEYPRLKPGESFKDCDICPEIVVIPAGSFTMGSPVSEKGRSRDEGPQLRMAIPRPFALGRYEVTRGEFAAFVKATGHQAGDFCWVLPHGSWKNKGRNDWRDPGFQQTDRSPVVCVSWKDAQAYIEWLSRKTGKVYRLPSESEWEYAARARTTTARYWGNDENTVCAHANVNDRTAKVVNRFWGGANCDDAHGKTAPVGSFPPNGFGLYDVLGNAWEWTEDCWNGSYSGAPADGTAWTAGECSRRVLRGGSWMDSPSSVCSAYRYTSTSDNWDVTFGFRVARTLD